jgi:microcystin-dependent protein
MDSFTGEIRILPYTFPPLDWAYCNGLQIAVMQNQALYSLIGNLYGGTVNQNFNLPNLAAPTQDPGAAPMGVGSGPGLTPRALQAASVGSKSVVLTTSQIPQHNHTVTEQHGNATDIVAEPNGNWLSHGEVLSTQKTFTTFAPFDVNKVTAFKNPLGSVGNGHGHENRHPYLPMNFCICLYGIYPIRP